MTNLEKKVKQMTAIELTCEFDRLLSLVEKNNDPKLFKLVDAKKLVYVDAELKVRLHELLPGLPKVEPQAEPEPGGSNYMNEILSTYYKRKSKAKSKTESKSRLHLRFFVKVTNSLNTTVASVPVMAPSKEEAIEIVKNQSLRFGKNVNFEVC